MDIQALTQQLTTFLAPFLPYLLKAGEEAAKEVGEKFGATAWEQAKTLWDKLHRKEKVAQVAQTAAALPDNRGMQIALQEEIAKALQADPALAAEITRLWGQAQAAGVAAIASGNRSVAIGGNASGNIIITGDNSRVQK